MKEEVRRSLAQALIALGDDEAILAQRDAEWTGHAPILEEDIAFANIALDELGHAGIWYRLAAELLGESPDALPDRLVFRREADAFRCIRMVELPRGDWALTIVRQFLFDAAEVLRLRQLADSAHRPLAEAAAKILTEERYHERHGRAWLRRLGRGTEESRRRTQAALDQLWPVCGQLSAPVLEGAQVIPPEVWPLPAAFGQQWEAAVRPHLGEAGLLVPPGAPPRGPGREHHTEHLGRLVDEMQSVSRLEPGAMW